MAELKKLHVGGKLEDLEKLAVIPDVRTKSMKILLNSARTLFMTAEEHRLDGDEEMAYIMYMKYFNLLSYIRKKPDYPQHKHTVRNVLGDNETNRRTMDRLELLSDSLSKRYKLQHNAKQTPNAIIALSPNHRTTPELNDVVVPNGKLQIKDADVEYRQLGLISCETLFQRIQQKSVLVMDCRTNVDYENSHLTYSYAFNVPEDLIAPGMSAGKLQAKLNSSAKALWSARSVKDSVVLMDWNTKDAQPASSTAIATLLDILKNWDVDVTYRAPIQILEGGYEYFIMMYPTQCTNPSVQAPQQNNNIIETLDDIEYDSIYEITMKDDIRARDFPSSHHQSKGSALMPPPSIDRASKQAAVRTYEERSKPLDQILLVQAELLQKAQQNDILLDNASKKWNTIVELKRKSAEGASLSASEQEVLFNVLQLESIAEDYKIENNQLRDELNRFKEQQQQHSATTTSQPSAKDVEVTKRIETKIQERQMLDEQHERERVERERQLAIAREAKRHYNSSTPATSPIDPHKSPPSPSSSTLSLQSMTDRQYKSSTHHNNISIDTIKDEQEPPPPPPAINNTLLNQRPTYNRAMKPLPPPTSNVNIQPSTAARKRDFSPIVGQNVGRGLTGLKNLGNTCYMNSILQCLSNTPQLTEFCISDKYKNFISRSNKTNGQVIEEVAALIKELWNGNYKCVASKDLRYVVGQYQKIFRGVDQQDSHEFLTILMDWLHADLQTLQVKPRVFETINASEKAWMEFTKSKESLILHLFYGQMKSTVKCVSCHKESATYECFSNISLELPPNANVCHLQQCMDMYFSGEHIHGWNCPNCKTKRDAIKKLDISKLPPVLVVHLKRFFADPNDTSTYIKKQNYLRFPLENLDMKPYTARVEQRTVTPKTYQLYGVSNHYGSMESGHYTAFCKSSNYGRWFKFDDQIVTALDPSNVVSSAAYILFYTWLPPVQL